MSELRADRAFHGLIGTSIDVSTARRLLAPAGSETMRKVIEHEEYFHKSTAS
jgi:hypothetical protein